MLPVDLLGVHVQPETGAPVLLLRDRLHPRRVLPIFVGGSEALAIITALRGEEMPRPLTHDLTASIVRDLGATLVAAEVIGLTDGAFIASLRFETGGRTIEVDARPSDAIALALRFDAPISVDDQVLDDAGVAYAEAPSSEEIEAEVASFRDQLQALDPSDFAVTTDEGEHGPTDPDASDDGHGDDS